MRAALLNAAFVLAAITLAGQASAQNYTVVLDNQPYTLLGAGRTTLWRGDVNPTDDGFAEIPIGFAFDFYDIPYTHLVVSANGYATFPGQPGGAYGNAAIPDATAPNPVLAPWWDDLRVANYGGSVDEVAYETQGVFPFKRLVVEWRSVSRYTNNVGNYHYLYFQLILNQLGDSIRFHYGSSAVVGAPPSDFSATIGIENESGLCGAAPLAGSPNLALADFPAANTAIKFLRTAAENYSVEVDQTPFTPHGAMATTLWTGSTAANPVAGHDDQYTDITMGFPFEYYGNTYSDIRVSTNGYITLLGENGTMFVNSAIPDASGPNPVIAPWWDDLKVADLGSEDRVTWDYDGWLPGHRRTSIEWYSVSGFGDSVTDYRFLYFQVKFFEEDNSIEFRYGNSGQVGAPPPFTATLGIEDPTGTIGVQPLAGSPSLAMADFPAPNTVIRFRPPTGACTPLLCGDCNSDAVVNIIDALSAARHAAGLDNLTGAVFAACNVSGTPGDDTTPGADVSILDALAIGRYVALIVPALTCSP